MICRRCCKQIKSVLHNTEHDYNYIQKLFVTYMSISTHGNQKSSFPQKYFQISMCKSSTASNQPLAIPAYSSSAVCLQLYRHKPCIYELTIYIHYLHHVLLQLYIHKLFVACMTLTIYTQAICSMHDLYVMAFMFI